MLQAFALIYLIAIVFLACDNNILKNNIHDINVLMAFLSLAFLGLAYIRRKERFRISLLPVSLIIFLLYSAGSFYLSFNADLSIYPTFKVICALFLTLALLLFLKNIKVLEKAMLIIFAFAGILAASEIFEIFYGFLQPVKGLGVEQARSYFLNVNFFAGYLLIHIPIGIFIYFWLSNTFYKNLIGIGWILVLVALGLTQSQAGQLIAGLLIAVIIRNFIKINEPSKAKLVGMGVLVSILIYFSILKILIEPNQFVPMTSVGQPEVYKDPWVLDNVVTRMIYGLGAWRIFLEHWLLGSGLWTFIEIYPQMGLEGRPPHAHNMYLQTLAETGFLGLGLFIACLTCLYSNLTRIFKQGRPEVVELNFYIALSLAGFLLNNLSEYNWLTANFIYYFVFLIIAVEVLNRETNEQIKGNLISKGNGVIAKAIPIFMVLGAYVIWQYYSYQRIITHNIPLSNTTGELLENIDRAKQFCQRCGKPYYFSGVINLEVYGLSKNNQNLMKAEYDLNEVIQRNPYDMGTHLMLGTINRLKGNIFLARKYIRRASYNEGYRKEAIRRLNKLREIENSE